MKNKQFSFAHFLLFLLFLFSLFAFWELMGLLSHKIAFILPRPSRIFFRVFHSFDLFYLHSLVTIQEMMWGFFLSFFLAFGLSLLMLRSSFASLTLQPFFVIIQCIPMFTLAPIMIVWFGWSKVAIIIPTALMIFLPLTLNIYRGLSSTPRYLVDFFMTHGATPWQTFLKLQLPWAIPHVFSGLRISTAVAGIGAVGGEWAGAQEGLGLLMQESRRSADFEMAFAALFCLILITLFFYSFLIFVEKSIFKNHFNSKVKVC